MEEQRASRTSSLCHQPLQANEGLAAVLAHVPACPLQGKAMWQQCSCALINAGSGSPAASAHHLVPCFLVKQSLCPLPAHTWLGWAEG